jgi:hypothetical protein
MFLFISNWFVCSKFAHSAGHWTGVAGDVIPAAGLFVCRHSGIHPKQCAVSGRWNAVRLRGITGAGVGPGINLGNFGKSILVVFSK